MSENRGPWYLITGLILGIALGVGYAWMARPLRYIDTTPASLHSQFKAKYRTLIASAYIANGDLVRAKARLGLLGDADVYRELAQQAQQTLADGGSTDEARALGLLAVSLGQPPKPAASKTAPGANPSPTLPIELTPTATATAPPIETKTVTGGIPSTSTFVPDISLAITNTITPSGSFTFTRALTATVPITPTPTGTRPPTPTPSVTPGAPFVLKSMDRVCDAKLEKPLIQISAYDAADAPVPGLGIIVDWDGGEEAIYTGLKPEINLGYADFSMTASVTYTVRMAEGGQPASDIAVFDCTDTAGKKYPGSWQVIFVQP